MHDYYGAELQHLARERCGAGRLPSQPPAWTRTDYGSGDGCALCGDPISSSELEYEVGVLIEGCDETIHFSHGVRVHMATGVRVP